MLRATQIFDTVKDGDTERRVLNTVETEAAKEKLQKIKTTFQAWIWSDPDRTDRLARLYNDAFNNIAPRSFNGDHLKVPGASGACSLYGHQKRAIWRIISVGSTYVAHAVGAGKTLSMAAAIMEQRRFGLVNRHAGRSRPLPGAGRPRVPGALSERPDSGRRRDQFRQGEAASLSVAGSNRELGRDHHLFGVPLHFDPLGLRKPNDSGRARGL
ncbi:hypothetical protein BFN67_21970 [Pseudaminobacter manganicus]|uniref:Helicase/UvrB N-terminal domain-containing protein n=1 Tax=Manganibacter manganicus TaxID=1873176 RepID=A0A1V8RML4_9HYPH|nr:hypothetical protein BFN67_21970 [Pseudaminobacter manganicus]